jgi:hypothetical protein
MLQIEEENHLLIHRKFMICGIQNIMNIGDGMMVKKETLVLKEL